VWLQTERVTSPAHHYFTKTGKKAEVPMPEVMAMSAAERKKLTHQTDDANPDQVDEEATVAMVHNVKTNAR
jgi:hypothetical protein